MHLVTPMSASALDGAAIEAACAALARHGVARLALAPDAPLEDVEALLTDGLGLAPSRLFAGSHARGRAGGWARPVNRVPGVMPIPPHCEDEFWHLQPARIAFFCRAASARGGETPIFDLRAAWRALPPDLQARLSGLEITFHNRLADRRWQLDLPGRERPNTWQEVFETDEPAAVEAALAQHAERVSARWVRGGLAVDVRHPGALRLPDGETALRPLAHVTYRRRVFLGTWRERVMPRLPSGERALARLGAAALGVFAPRTIIRALTVRPAPLSDADCDAVNAAIWDAAQIAPWRPGGLLVIDNLRWAHARLNAASPRSAPRRIYAWLCDTGAV